MDEWENWETVSIEAELDRLRDEREEKEKPAPATGATATGATTTGEKSGCGKMLLYFVLGILLIKSFGEIISIFFSN
jgi:hypothetical protein